VAVDTAGPLDPLSAAEIATVFRVVEVYAKFPQGAFFPVVTLREPPKGAVLSWSPGRPFPRAACAQVYDPPANRLFEAVVDLRTKRVVSWAMRPHAQPAVFGTEYAEADAAVRADPRWQAAMRERGVDPDDVYLDVWAPGGLALPGVGPGTRLLRALSFLGGKLPNPYDRPIEGVVATVDMSTLEVVDFVDTGVRPVDTTASGSATPAPAGLRPLVVTQPEGPSFTITGGEVVWQHWHFRVGFTMREGLVLYEIGYEQHGVVRPIVYRMSLDEIYVPYALPDRTWAWRAALDVGEYDLGQFVEPLRRNVDVPNNAVFLDEAVPSDQGSDGGVYALPRAVALYEEDAGSLWNRTDPITLGRDARLARELVVTASYVNGNYTYTTEYVFRMDGGIDVRAGATGTTLNRAVRSAAQGDRFGQTVAPNVAAPAHQHFFNFRIDFDVDGTRNRLVEEDTRAVPSRYGNAFTTNRTVLRTEQARDLDPAVDRRWVVESTTGRNALGDPTGYELAPADGPVPYSSPGFVPLRRAAFAQHALWVTRYRDGELYAAGDFPNQGPPGRGLPRYVAQRSGVDGQDLVIWYTVGFTHDPTVEEYPVMTREVVGFTLRPDGFFDRNPAFDAP